MNELMDRLVVPFAAFWTTPERNELIVMRRLPNEAPISFTFARHELEALQDQLNQDLVREP